MSRLGTYLAALQTSIAGAGLGLTAADVIIEPEADVWNQIATSIQAASNGIVLVLEEVQGRNPDVPAGGLAFELTVTVTLVAEPHWHRADSSTPESVRTLLEGLWALLHTLPDPARTHSIYETRVEGWGRIESRDGYIMRQTILRKLLPIT